ncbi:glycosyltransferase [Chryseobacterium sp. MDT2-18]|uniref:glycosyltransferase n=1 Tax=Chryseobacterium sp. MDT2-18 TaxID=1259136 RepID=UPI002788E7C1|nr:glycosyltransferase [Chryseobacterium sp. MDT2-18]MDQ0476442.1 glycosyltransferase involved in cell wall biosynthesis [Chryseobacterium sp. MDT2-18]
MNVLFLCGLYPQAHQSEIFANSKKGYQFAAQTLQEAIIEGFIQNDINLSIVTMPFLSTFPAGYKKPLVKFGPSEFNGRVPTFCSTFINIPFLRQVYNSTEKNVFNWCKSIENPSEIKHIIVYSLTVDLIKIALKVKETFANVRLTLIVPDLPEFMGSNKIYTALGLKKRDVDFIYKNISAFDRFVLLSEAMALPLNISPESYCVVEGIFDPKLISAESSCSSEKTQTLLYSGALVRKYGIETLLNAFSSLKDENYRLIICGDGEAKDLVETFCEKDDRISYLGKLPHSEILSLQKQAALLINPRTPEGEFTKFSFPSKTMEYFASKTPVLMYKLPGVPAEYFKYCYTLEGTDAQNLAEKITEILSLPENLLQEMGQSASDFILEEKNPEIQVKKIIDLMAEH